MSRSDEPVTAGPAVRIRGSRSVGIAGNNSGYIHIGDRITLRAPSVADPAALAADRLAAHLKGSWEQEARSRGLAVGSMIDLSWNWSKLGSRPAYVYREPLKGSGPRPLPGMVPPAVGRRPAAGRMTDLFGSLYARLPHGRLGSSAGT